MAATGTGYDRTSVEGGRGCTEGGRFCQAGMIYRPVRERDPQEIVETIVRAVKSGGYDEASLTCLSTADYSAIKPLVKTVMDRLEGEKVSLSVSSLRAYGLDEELLDELQRVRATGLTFAPEAGTQRMRDVVNKNVPAQQLTQTAERLVPRGWARMKPSLSYRLPPGGGLHAWVQWGRPAGCVGQAAWCSRGPAAATRSKRWRRRLCAQVMLQITHLHPPAVHFWALGAGWKGQGDGTGPGACDCSNAMQLTDQHRCRGRFRESADCQEEQILK